VWIGERWNSGPGGRPLPTNLFQFNPKAGRYFSNYAARESRGEPPFQDETAFRSEIRPRHVTPAVQLRSSLDGVDTSIPATANSNGGEGHRGGRSSEG